MTFVAKDYSGEWIFDNRPYIDLNSFVWGTNGKRIKLPEGSIRKLIGRELTWEDDPVELKE